MQRDGSHGRLLESGPNKKKIHQLESELQVAKMMANQHLELRKQAEMHRNDMYKELETLISRTKSLEDEKESAVSEMEKALKDKEMAETQRDTALAQIKELQDTLQRERSDAIQKLQDAIKSNGIMKNEIDIKKIKFVTTKKEVDATKDIQVGSGNIKQINPVLDRKQFIPNPEIEKLGKPLLEKGKAQELLDSGDYQKAAVVAIEEINYQK